MPFVAAKLFAVKMKADALNISMLALSARSPQKHGAAAEEPWSARPVDLAEAAAWQRWSGGGGGGGVAGR